MNKIYTLHGFLGKPHDWESLLPQACAVNVFANICPFWQWANHFNASTEEGNILIGYSLGGRLAMHALLDRPKHWKAAVIISAHPGLESHDEKAGRFKQDNLWAERFLKDPWERLMTDWNSQSVFQGDHSFERKEADFDRAALASALREWSLAHQENLMPRLSQLEIPILWIAGSQDTKYAKLYESLPIKLSHSKKWIASNASHRVPWQQSKQFCSQIFEFLHARSLL